MRGFAARLCLLAILFAAASPAGPKPCLHRPARLS